jgi:hypothetical protein
MRLAFSFVSHTSLTLHLSKGRVRGFDKLSLSGLRKNGNAVNGH